MRKTITALFLLLMITFQSTSIVYPKWETHVVDPIGVAGSIAFDSRDNPHISYNADPFEVNSVPSLKYAVWTGTNWTTQTVDHVGYGQIAVDSQGRPHIGYSNGSLVYASYDGSTWDKQIVDQGEIFSVSLALDSNDQPHLSYIENGSLKYAKSNNSTWITQTIDSQGQSLTKSYIALDKYDHSQTIYAEELDYETSNIRYAYWTGSEWRVQTAFLNASRVGNMVLDSNGRPHLVYIRSDTTDTGTLTYAYWKGSTWNTQVVDSKCFTAYEPLLALDSRDKPHIFYYMEEQKTLNIKAIYAKWTGSSWESQTALDPRSVVYFNGLPTVADSMVIDSHDRLHLTTVNVVGTIHGAARWGNLTYYTLENDSGIFILLAGAAIAASVALAAVGVLVYFKKRKH